MKKFYSLGLLIIFLFSFLFSSSTITEAASSEVNLSVSLNSITCISNKNVGSDWGFSCIVNKTLLQKGSTIKISSTTNNRISITVTAVEEDTDPDSNTKSLSIPVGNLKEGNNPYSLQVTVAENSGEYLGNKATWKFSFTIKKASVIKTQTISQVPNDKIRNGEDKYIWPDGTKYIGNWENNELNGEGVLSYANGDKYAGSFVNNKKCGNGTYIWANGEIYAGKWLEDKMSGSGIYTFKNGEKYDGNWDAGFMNGSGTYTFKNGTTLTGIWVDNQYSSED